MKSLFFLSVSVLLCLGCSHSRFVLHDAAREGSARGPQRVEVSSKDRLSIFFRADGETQSIPEVNAVAAEGQYLLVSSEEWKTVQQIPRRYVSMSGIRVRSPSSDYDEPTVGLPVSSIEEIRTEERDLQWPPVMERIGKVSRDGFSRGLSADSWPVDCSPSVRVSFPTLLNPMGALAPWTATIGKSPGPWRSSSEPGARCSTLRQGCSRPSPGRPGAAIAAEARVSDWSSGTEGMEGGTTDADGRASTR